MTTARTPPECSSRRLTVYEVVRTHGLLPATADFHNKMQLPSAVRILHHTLPAHVLLRLLESIRPVCKADSKVGVPKAVAHGLNLAIVRLRLSTARLRPARRIPPSRRLM